MCQCWQYLAQGGLCQVLGAPWSRERWWLHAGGGWRPWMVARAQEWQRQLLRGCSKTHDKTTRVSKNGFKLYGSARLQHLLKYDHQLQGCLSSGSLWLNSAEQLYGSAGLQHPLKYGHQLQVFYKGRLSRFELSSVQWCIAIILQCCAPAPAKVWSSVVRLSWFELPSIQQCRAMILRYHTAATTEVWSSVARPLGSRGSRENLTGYIAINFLTFVWVLEKVKEAVIIELQRNDMMNLSSNISDGGDGDAVHTIEQATLEETTPRVFSIIDIVGIQKNGSLVSADQDFATVEMPENESILCVMPVQPSGAKQQPKRDSCTAQTPFGQSDTHAISEDLMKSYRQYEFANPVSNIRDNLCFFVGPHLEGRCSAFIQDAGSSIISGHESWQGAKDSLGFTEDGTQLLSPGLSCMRFWAKGVPDGNQRSEHEGLAGVEKADVEKGLATAENEEALHLLEHNHERHEEESIVKLKEKLQLT
ncbi:hypothetical protein F4604DRAFT_1677460 [Suillus subluteus]|nr:hypothetical protein F4604DRAFT_1677460 [Suillus subluteus]